MIEPQPKLLTTKVTKITKENPHEATHLHLKLGLAALFVCFVNFVDSYFCFSRNQGF
jgi:hypothetical protein